MIKDAIIGASKNRNETVTLKPNQVLAANSNILANQIALNVAPSVLLNQLNSLPSNQIINSSNTLSAVGSSVGQSRIFIMPNRPNNETATTVSFPSAGLVNIQPGRPASTVAQMMTNSYTSLIGTTAKSKVQLINPSTPSTCNSLPFVKAPIPIQIPQSLSSQIITTLPTTKYVTFAQKSVAAQPSQLSKIIVPSVPPLSKISTPQTIRFQTISSDVPAIQPKTNAANKQFVVQQRLRDQGQGQSVRYILPAQSQLPSGQIINLNQLGSVQNLFINNVPIAKNPTTKSVRIVSGNLSNGVAKSPGNKILVTPALGTDKLSNGSPVLGNSTQVKVNEAILMRSPVKVGISPNNLRPQMTCTPTTSPVFTIPSNIIAKKTDNIQQNIVISNAVTSTPNIDTNAVVNNYISLSRPTVPLQANIVKKIELNPHNVSSALVARHPLIIQPSVTPKIDPNSLLNSNSSFAPPRQPLLVQSSILPESRKLLPKTTSSSVPNGVTAPTGATSQSGNVKSDCKATEKQRHVVLDPTQLQKLKDEGRIVMTPTGQLIMIPPNLVGKVPGSVFK